MSRIRDFFYNFLEFIIAMALLAYIIFVLTTNLQYLMNLDQNAVIATSSEKVDIQVSDTTSVILPTDLNVEQLATVLEGYKVISNKEEFINKFNEINSEAIISSGSFDISSDASVEDVIKIVTE